VSLKGAVSSSHTHTTHEGDEWFRVLHGSAQLVSRTADTCFVKRLPDSSEWPLRQEETTRHDERPTLDAHAHAHAHDPRPTTHAHAHAHAHGHGHGRVDEQHESADITGGFPHEKLDAYQVALKMAALAKKVAEQIPRGHRNVADHMLRAASNTVLLLAEGANRRGVGEKRQRFAESRGECGEVGAAGDLLLAYDIASRADAETLKRLASRVSAMLTRLIGRLDERRP
jgi:four helix bundle protein